MSYEYMTGLGDEAADLQAFRTKQFQTRSRIRKQFAPPTSTPGDPCRPPAGGLVRKFHSNIANTPADQVKILEKIGRILKAGCQPTGRFYDMYKAEVCCPPGTPSITHLFPLPQGFDPSAVTAPVVTPAEGFVLPPIMAELLPKPPVVPVEDVAPVTIPPDELDPESPVEQATPVQIAPEELDPESPSPPEDIPVVANGNGMPVVANGNGFAIPDGIPDCFSTSPAEECWYDANLQSCVCETVELPPMPPVTNGNGAPVTNGNGAPVTNGNGAPVTNGNGAAVAEETMYFGLTQTQLMIAGVAGAAALYFLVLKK